jgi:hypothetical protein
MLAIICRGLPLTRANPVCTSTTLNDEGLTPTSTAGHDDNARRLS